MASTTGDLDRLSGVVLPLILQRKLQSQQQVSGDSKEDTKIDNDDTNDALQEDDGRANVVFTAEELDERVWKARAAMADIQRQLLRGEESYYEETSAHGNLFRGWDLFIDAKDSAPSVSAGNRRMPADFRWFSSSCASTGKNPPRPLSTKTLASLPPAVKANAVRSTVNLPYPLTSSAVVPHRAAVNAGTAGGSVGQAQVASFQPSGSTAQQANALGGSDKAEATRPSLPVGVQATANVKTDMNKGQDMMNQSKTQPAPVSTPAAPAQPKADTSTGRRTRKRKSSES